MPCYHPLEGWRSRERNRSGKRSIVFNRRDGYVDQPVEVPCGRCIGCRLERSRQWAMRLMHESTYHDSNVFLTLTYSDDRIPYDHGLRKSDFQNFIKRLRKRIAPSKIRYFHCGEYGDSTDRPHYHAILYGIDFPDKVFLKEENGGRLFQSDFLNSVWGHGQCMIGDVTFESCAYVARYIMKKVNGEKAEKHYEVIDALTGEIFNRQPEYITFSTRPAIGERWFQEFCQDTFKDDKVIMRGKALPAPKRYLQKLQMDNLPWKMIFSCTEDVQRKFFLRVAASRYVHDQVRGDRIIAAKERAWNNTPERLRVREIVKAASVKSLKRSL